MKQHTRSMNWLVAAPLLTLLLTGCSSTDQEEPQPPRLLDVLAHAETADYDEARNCLSRHDFNHVEVLGARHVAFKGPGTRLWVNELRQVCAGLRPGDALRINYKTQQLCSLDTIQGILRGADIFDRMGPVCTLGEFHPVTEDQLAMLRDTLH